MSDGLKLEALGCRSLNHLDLTLSSGQAAGITGPSGTGKSLLLRAMADLDPHEGRMWLDDVAADQILAPQWRFKVALLPAEAAWWFDTVGEHFEHWPPYGLEQLGFDSGAMTWQVSHLSSGERQRLSLLRVLVNQPRVLLLDEPTANLDDTNTERAERLIDEYRRQHRPVIVWVSHDLEQLRRWCDPIYILGNGRLAISEAGRIPA
jgi:ABC-type multidrug transport system ATPase subunit